MSDLQETTNKILYLQESKNKEAKVRINELETLCNVNVKNIVEDNEREVNIEDLYNNLSELKDLSKAYNLDFEIPFENMYYSDYDETWSETIYKYIDRDKYKELFHILYDLQDKSQRWHHSLAQDC